MNTIHWILAVIGIPGFLGLCFWLIWRASFVRDMSDEEFAKHTGMLARSPQSPEHQSDDNYSERLVQTGRG